MNFNGREAIRALVQRVREIAPTNPQNTSERFVSAVARAPSPEELKPDVDNSLIMQNIDPANPKSRAQAAIALSLASRRTINIGDINDIETWRVL